MEWKRLEPGELMEIAQWIDDNLTEEQRNKTLSLLNHATLGNKAGNNMESKITLYGDIAVKFRAFGRDLGYAKRTINYGEGPIIHLPVPLPFQVPIKFEKYGIRLSLFLAPA